MDKRDSDFTERFFNFTNTSGSNMINFPINYYPEKDSVAAESDHEKKKLQTKGEIFYMNYFDLDEGKYKKISVMKVKN